LAVQRFNPVSVRQFHDEIITQAMNF
jgi:hypothetical protein